ncbi:MAG: aldehyde ferredoxin oxidoreductase C-terminal domain-containing protein, partial [Planctomycetota bacterium]
TAVTGVESSAQDLLAAGERIYYHERMMNAANGFGIDDDDLPPRFFTEAGSSGNNITIHPIDRGEFETARDHYYRVRGLTETGAPIQSKAESLGIPWKSC